MSSYVQAVWDCRYFWLSLVKIDLRTRYRRSVIGIGWSLLRPIAMTFILYTVFRRIIHVTDPKTYAPYLLAGLTCWEYIMGTTKQGCQSLFQGEAYIRQYPAPIAIYPLRTALGETVHFLLSLIVVIGLAWYVKGFGNALALLSLIPGLVLLFLLVWSLAVLASFANVYFQDTQHLCDVGFQILFYATPIIYKPDDLKPVAMDGFHLSTFLQYNPVVPFLDLIRKPILEGCVPQNAYITASVVVLVVGGLAVATCARLQQRVIFHL